MIKVVVRKRNNIFLTRFKGGETVASDILDRIETYFSSPLKDGERRKILYLYDKEETYLEEIEEWSQATDYCIVLKVTTSNYFHTNYLIEKEYINENIFLYFVMDKPAVEDNPLLDVVLYSEELKVDEKSQLYLTLGINTENQELVNVIDAYSTFFRAKDRTNRFKRLFNRSPSETSATAEYSILAALTKAPQPTWISVLIELFEEEATQKQDKWDNILKFGDESRFWTLMDEIVGYSHSTSPSGNVSIKEMMHQVFMTYLDTELEGESPREIKPYILPKANAVIVFINQWMNTKDKEEAYYIVSTVVEDEWDLDYLFEDISSSKLADLETFRWFDFAFIDQVVQTIQLSATDNDRLVPLISKRRNTLWYKEFRDVYHFLHWAIRLDHYREIFEEEFQSFVDAESIWKYYSEFIYHIDQSYRKMYVYWDQLSADFKDRVSDVKKIMERVYINRFLPAYTEKWDRYFDNDGKLNNQKLQSSFFNQEIQPYTANDRRIFVIISDGLRYEAGKELFLALTKETKFSGDIDWMRTELPSITSIGMANLLPHSSIQYSETGDILVDQQSSKGIENRETILKASGHPDSIALTADQLNQMNKSQLREKFAGKKLIYIYHNKIDAVGDHRPTEQDVFDATQESIEELYDLLHRLTNELSAGSLFVTADHGYLYTRTAIPNSAKVDVDTHSNDWIKNKRFILSESKKETMGLSFPLSERLDSNGYVTVPRGMNRFALNGGGYQYVHGGHLPQEMMVPLLRIKTNRNKNTLKEVEVNLVNQYRKITNNVVWFKFLQVDPVTENVKDKRLNMYFEDEQGNKISNEVTLIADSEQESSENRIFTEKFVLLNESFNPYETYYFVMENSFDETDRTKEPFKINIV